MAAKRAWSPLAAGIHVGWQSLAANQRPAATAFRPWSPATRPMGFDGGVLRPERRSVRTATRQATAFRPWSPATRPKDFVGGALRPERRSVRTAARQATAFRLWSPATKPKGFDDGALRPERRSMRMAARQATVPLREHDSSADSFSHPGPGGSWAVQAHVSASMSVRLSTWPIEQDAYQPNAICHPSSTSGGRTLPICTMILSCAAGASRFTSSSESPTPCN